MERNNDNYSNQIYLIYIIIYIYYNTYIYINIIYYLYIYILIYKYNNNDIYNNNKNNNNNDNNNIYILIVKPFKPPGWRMGEPHLESATFDNDRRLPFGLIFRRIFHHPGDKM